jgi:hypothetical protein
VTPLNHVFRRNGEAGYLRYDVNALGTLRDMLEARDHPTACPKKAGIA